MLLLRKKAIQGFFSSSLVILFQYNFFFHNTIFCSVGVVISWMQGGRKNPLASGPEKP
jgi:hypothetical protein